MKDLRLKYKMEFGTAANTTYSNDTGWEIDRIKSMAEKLNAAIDDLDIALDGISGDINKLTAMAGVLDVAIENLDLTLIDLDGTPYIVWLEEQLIKKL